MERGLPNDYLQGLPAIPLLKRYSGKIDLTLQEGQSTQGKGEKNRAGQKGIDSWKKKGIAPAEKNTERVCTQVVKKGVGRWRGEVSCKEVKALGSHPGGKVNLTAMPDKRQFALLSKGDRTGGRSGGRGHLKRERKRTP